jgi:hypothetical protein
VRAAGALDFKQRIELWRHPIISEQQLAKRGLSRQIQLLARWHHEWWNGCGYPDMLAGAAIPLGARIIRLVDTYDALIAARPYREAYNRHQAQEIIAAGAGIEFDPQLAKIFLAMLDEMRAAEVARLAAQTPQPPVPEIEPDLAPAQPSEPIAPADDRDATAAQEATAPAFEEANVQAVDEMASTRSDAITESEDKLEKGDGDAEGQ